MINAEASKPKELFPAGAYPARIYQIVQIGTVPGFEGKLQNKVRITFEFPTETEVFKEEKGPQPKVMSKEFTLSTHEKAELRKVITACDPATNVTSYDIENLMGKACLVTVGHGQKKDGSGKYATMTGFTFLPKGMLCPDPVNPPQKLSYDDFNLELFNKLPEFIKEKMRQSFEFRGMDKKETFHGMGYPDGPASDEIPF